MILFSRHLSISILFTAFVCSSCSVYYNTSEINSNLTQFVSQVQKNYSSTKTGLEKIEQNYSQLNASDKEEPFLSASKKLQLLDKQLANISQLRNKITIEYSNFKSCSKGMSKISSKDKEWDLLKETKEKMKTFSDQVQIKSNEFVVMAKDFEQYINTNILPIIKVYKIDEYKNQFSLFAKNMATLETENLKALLKYKTILEQLEKQYSNTHTEQLKELKTMLVLVASKTKLIKDKEQKLSSAIKEFNSLTNSIDQLYSSDPLFSRVKTVQEEIDSHVKAIQNIQNEIKSLYSKFQTTTGKIQQVQK